MPHTVITQADALSRLPALGELPGVQRGGWAFHLLSENDTVSGVAASRSGARHTDVVFVFDQRQVLGMRVVPDGDGGIVWGTHGNAVADVARRLVQIPAPGEPDAPNVVLPVTALGAPQTWETALGGAA
ncbi:hypothetical protein [Actinokineospora iranica]|uniref:Uncharacterized protein n=1 Tax=Actinokineospora iranica TaxID=1271860 RepID=A0A1G6YTD4_9PSEU|nr:hypothetical protein [Actinokineospora iranica]SDD93618.1 hypothetical protein SAMN05216174_12338 [Actinokineospora iranica]